MRRVVQDLGFAGAGCLTTACQIHLTRECLTLFSGNELCLGAALGSWLCGIALGSSVGAWLARRSTSPGTSLAVALVLLSASCMTLLRLFRSLAGVGPGELPGALSLLLAGAVLVLPGAVIAGALFPLLCADSGASGDPQPVGRVYAIESLGAAAGGAFVSVWAAGTLSPFMSLALCALPALLFLPLARIPSSAWAVRRAAGLLPAILLLGAAASGLPSRLDEWSARLRFEQLTTGERLVASSDTPYQRLDLAEREDQFSLYADGKLLSTFPDPWRELPRAHLVLTQHPAPRRVLWLGSSGLLAAPAALRHGVQHLVIVDMDPGIGALIVPRLDEGARAALADERVRRVSGDGRRFLRETEERYDVIFSDAPDPLTAAQSRYFSLEFFRLARERLADGGLLALRLGGSFNVADPFTARRLLSTLATLRQVFPGARALPGAGTFLLGATDPDSLLLSAEALRRRFQERDVRDPQFHPAQFAAAFETAQVGQLEAALENGPAPSLNLDGRPTVMLSGILRESLIESPTSVAWLERLLAVPAWWWILLCLLPGLALMAWVAFGRKANERRRTAVVAFAVTVAGATGLGLEISLSLAYQTLAGSLYRELGFLLASFMLGLAAAGAPLRAYLMRRLATERMLAAWMLLFAGFCAGVPALLWAAEGLLPFGAGRAVLLALVFLSGAGTGVTFPLAARLSQPVGAGAAAARINRADHMGAAAGALLVGLLVLPVLGWTGACLLFAILLFQAAGLLWVAGAPSASPN